MPYTTEEGGRLNNFAREPRVYQAEPPNSAEKTQYIISGSIAAALVVSLVFIAFAVS